MDLCDSFMWNEKTVIPVLCTECGISQLSKVNTYRITSILKVETYIIINIAASLKGRTVILVIMHVETFKMDVIVFNSINRHNVTSH